MKLHRYWLKTYAADRSKWAPETERCRNGQGAGSAYGCILLRQSDEDYRANGSHKHVYDDDQFETVAEVNTYSRYQGECYLCHQSSPIERDPEEADRWLNGHMKENHPDANKAVI